MRNLLMGCISVLILPACLASGRWQTVDRIAIIVDQDAITLSDIYNEIRVTDFENGDKLDLSLKAQKKAAGWLVDQALIRKDMLDGGYPGSDPSASDRLVQQLRQRYPTGTAYLRALRSYGITQQILEDHVRRQLTVLRFITLRFSNGNPYVIPSSPRSLIPAGNEALSNWLDKMRRQTRIVFTMKSLEPPS